MKPTGSVSSTLRKYRMSSSTLYKWKGRYNENGPEGLKAKPPIRISPPPSIPKEYVQAILRVSGFKPGWGCKKISKRMIRDGKQVSHTTVQKVLSQNGRATRRDRGIKASSKIANVKADSKVEELASTKSFNAPEEALYGRIRKLKAKLKPGEFLVQSVHQVKIPPPIKSAFLQEIVDLHSSFGTAVITTNNLLSFSEDILRDTIVVFQKDFGVKVLSVITGKGFPNSKSYKSYVESFLEPKKIKHIEASWSSATPPLEVARLFHNEVMSVVIRKLPKAKHKNLKDVQKALNTRLKRYNHKPNDLDGGKSPWEMMTC